VLELGLGIMRNAAQESNAAILHHDHAMALFAAGRPDEARRALSAALDLDPTNEAIAERLRSVR
jgi:Flp pilus assembly protein TadD